MTAQPASHPQTGNSDFGFGFNDGTLPFMPEVDVRPVPPSSDEEGARVPCAPDHPDLFLGSGPADLFDRPTSPGESPTSPHAIK